MIDKVPETTALECTLPKPTGDRLAAFARERSLTIDEMLSEAIDQSCERREREDVPGPAEVTSPGFDLPTRRGTPIDLKRDVSHRPDPPMIDECESIPVELPGSPSTPITVTRTVKQWPERLHDDA